jgi:orotidine-5'-phosphate decarboxylase
MELKKNSIKKMPKRDNLIVALDFPDYNSAKILVEQLGDRVTFYKIGLELLMSGNYFDLIEFLAKKNKKMFIDLKFFDIGQTVVKAIENLNNYPNIIYTTIHSTNRESMERIAESKGNIKILAVTILTSFNQNDLSDMNLDPTISLEDIVIKRAKLAKESNIDGVICSAFENKRIRSEIGQDFIIANPGIRLEKLQQDDQKRIVDVKTAIADGANHIVVGRPINRAIEPRKMAEEFLKEIPNATT